jgi:hypothetical protein
MWALLKVVLIFGIFLVKRYKHMSVRCGHFILTLGSDVIFSFRGGAMCCNGGGGKTDRVARTLKMF